MLSNWEKKGLVNISYDNILIFIDIKHRNRVERPLMSEFEN